MAHPHAYHFGVVVGIDTYPSTDIDDLHFARKDANDFYDWLTDEAQGGVPPENVEKVIIRDQDLPAGMTAETAIPNQLAVFERAKRIRKKAEAAITTQAAWDVSRFYLFVSGHGIAPIPREAALVTANASRDDLHNISTSAILRFLETEQLFRELVFFADCCRERIEDATLVGPTWSKVTRNNGQVEKCVSYATYFGDLAHEPLPEEIAGGDPDARRGYFTRALIEGLRGQAVDPGNPGEINSNSLAAYLRSRVENLTSHLVQAQTPNTQTDPGRPIVFRTGVSDKEVEEASTHGVEIEVSTPFTGRVVLREGDLTQVLQFDASPGFVQPVDLVNGHYQVAPADSDVANPFASNGLFAVLGDGPQTGEPHRVVV